jgi:hypothetical protein
VSGGAPAGADDQQAAGNLASAMANFSVRTGLVVAPDDQGRIVVQHVRPESDAARAGIKPGDVLSNLNGTKTNTMRELQSYLTAHASQSAFNVGLDRGSKTFSRPMGRQTSLLGMTVFPDSADRPVVNSVQDGSPAAKAGIRSGDVITGIDHQTTDTMDKFMNFSIPYVRDLSEGQKIPFRLARNGNPVNLSIPRPKDSELPPLSPSEQRILERQGGVLSTKTQEPVRQTPPVPERRQRPRMAQQQRQPQNGALAAQSGLGAVGQNPNQQGTNGLGGVGLGLGGLGGGVPGSTGTGTMPNALGSTGNVNSVVAVLYGTAQNTSQNTSQTAATSGQTGMANANRRARNGFTNSGAVGYVTIQSTVPLSQSATNPLGTTGNMGTNTGNTTTGVTGTGVNGTGTAGATTGTTATGATAGAGVTSQTNTGIPGSIVNPTEPNQINIPQIGAPGGANPVTGNTGNGTAAGNVNNNGNTNTNNPSTVSAQVVGLPAGQYALVVSQYGDCGDAAAVATGPVAANLGTIQVGANGQGVLQNVPVSYPPQAFLGRVVSLLPPTAPGTGNGVLVGRTGQIGNGTTTPNNLNPSTVLGCGVFGFANPQRPFAGGYQGGSPGNAAGGVGGMPANGGPAGTGNSPLNGAPAPKYPLGFGPSPPGSAAPSTP